MNKLYLRSWYYQGTGGEDDARRFYGKLRDAVQSGNGFPFDCTYQVALLHCSIDEHWCVGVQVLNGPEEEDPPQYVTLEKWFDECEADTSGSDRDVSQALQASVQGTLQQRYGPQYQSVETFGQGV